MTTTTQQKRILMLCRKPPYGNSLAREGLDLALALALFNQPLTLVFVGDGIWQLCKAQHSQALGTKNHGKMISALPMYEVNQVFVEQSSLAARNLTTEQLLIDVQVIDQPALAQLMTEHDVVFNF